MGPSTLTDPPFGLPSTFADTARELPFSGVYRLAPDGQLSLLTSELRAPNGIALSPDEDLLYVSNADRDDPVYLRFRVGDGGVLENGAVFYDASSWAGRFEGAPDGIEVDRIGNVWAAGPGGVHILTPRGTYLGSVITEVATSNVAWGGEGGGALYITAGDTVWRIRTAVGGRG